jgi:trans-2-enoyl-CoA reductase
MGLQPVRVPNGMLIFKNLHFTGFWVNKWYEQASAEARRETFAPLIDLTQRGLLETKVERAYSLGDFREAVARANEGKRAGKIIFRM